MITWTKDHPEAKFSTLTGIDDKTGDIFHMTANLEVVTVKTADGLTGQGWTVEEALKAAEENRIDDLAAEFEARSVAEMAESIRNNPKSWDEQS